MKFCDMPYERVDYEKFEQQLLALIEEFKAAKSGEEQFAVHKKYYKLMDDMSTNSTIANIRHDIDTKDEFYSKENDYYDETFPKIENLRNQYQKLVYESPYRAYLEEKIGPVAFKNIELYLKSFDESIVPLLQEQNALVTEYMDLIAGAQIDWEGETLNLSLLGKYLTDKNREVRKKAFAKRSAFFAENGAKIDEIYDKLVKNRTKQAKQLGYENYVQLGYYNMCRNSYGKAEVECFRKQVKELLVPFAEELHEKRRQRIGVEKLAGYDEGVYFAEGNPAPEGTPEEIFAAGKKMYTELSPETKEFFDFMLENELFDVLGRKTKRAGGYMTFLPNYESPFIFANFNGTSGDVDVMTHECGHAFQGFVTRKEEIKEKNDITMETAEIHSMSMEFFTEQWMPLFFHDRAADYEAMHLEDAIEFIPYGCMVDEFQHIVYEHPEFTPAERNAAWRKLEQEYKPHLDYEDDACMNEGRFWQKQQHIFASPFYYIDYCLAQTCALQFKAKMEEDFSAAWESYLKLCHLSASGFFADMIKAVGLRSPFEDGCIEEIVTKLRKRFL